MLEKFNKIEREITWARLGWLSSRKFISSSSFFLFFVPALAKILSDMPESIRVPLTGYELVLHLQLPFSWIILFFSALFILIGNTIFYMYCPPIVRKYESFSAYTAAGRSSLDLVRYIQDVVPASVTEGMLARESVESGPPRQNVLNFIFAKLLNNSAPGNHQTAVAECISLSTPFPRAQEYLARAFTAIRDASSYHAPLARIVTALFLALGLLCFLLILLQNFWYVLAYLF
jgi:hypothetical protein